MYILYMHVHVLSYGLLNNFFVFVFSFLFVGTLNYLRIKNSLKINSEKIHNTTKSEKSSTSVFCIIEKVM